MSQAKSAGLDLKMQILEKINDKEDLLPQLQELTGQASGYQDVQSFLSTISITKDTGLNSLLLLSFLDHPPQ